MLTLTNLTDICKRLNKAQVKYVIVGGFAVFLHGFERATKDIDLLVDPSEVNINKIKNSLKDLLPEACAEMEAGDVGKYTVVRMSGENMIVDLMGKIGDVGFFEAKVIKEEMNGVEIPMADLDTLLKLKEGVRDRDRRDYLFLKGKQEYLQTKGKK